MSIDLILLFASLFTWGIGEGMFIYFQPIYLQQLGASTMTIATVFSAFGLAMMLAHIPAGYLADRIGRKPIMIAAWASGLIATWVMAMARSLPVFIVGVLLYGLTAFVSSPLNSYMTVARGKLSPVRAMTLMSAAFNLGAVLGPISGGWLGERFGLRTVYLVAACIFIISTGILLFIRSQPRDEHDPASPPDQIVGKPAFHHPGGDRFPGDVRHVPAPAADAQIPSKRARAVARIHRPARLGGKPGECSPEPVPGSVRSAHRIPAGAGLGGVFQPAVMEGVGHALVRPGLLPAGRVSAPRVRSSMPRHVRWFTRRRWVSPTVWRKPSTRYP